MYSRSNHVLDILPDGLTGIVSTCLINLARQCGPSDNKNCATLVELHEPAYKHFTTVDPNITQCVSPGTPASNCFSKLSGFNFYHER